MRKITLFLSVLFMAIVVKAQVQATTSLVHTASSYCGTDKNAYTSTVDAEKEHINYDYGGNKNLWNGAAYAEFTVTLPDGNYSIKSASLAWSGVGSSKNRTTDIMYVNAGLSLDYESLATGNVKAPLDATFIETVSFPANKTSDFTTDVTDAVRAIIDAGQGYIIFKFTNNIGGGDLVGKGASEKFPVLTVELADASTMTTYTVKYVDEAGNEIAEAAVYDIVTGEVASIADENKVAIYNADRSKKYVYVSCDKESVTTVADGALNVITATFREAATYSYTVNGVDGEGNVLKVLAASSNFEGESITVPYNQYILVDDVLYSASANNKEYNTKITLSSDEQVSAITYSASSISDVVYFSEAEEIEGMTTTTGGNANIRCSNAAGGYNASTDPVVVTTLTPGVYNIAAQVWGNAGVEFNIVCGNDTLKVSTAGYITSGNTEFAVAEETEVVVLPAGANGKCLDWIYIQSVEKPLVVTDGEDLTATGSYSSASYVRQFNTAYTYGTICLPFAPDAATCANYTFYKLAEVNSEALIFEEEAAPKANTAYLYKLNDGVDAEDAKTFTGGVTTISDIVTEPVGGWQFSGSFAKDTITDLTDGEYWAYQAEYNGKKDVLVKAGTKLVAHPYRAYFKFVPTEELNFTPAAATMRMIIGGKEGGAMEIQEVIAPEQVEGAAFDLEGRPVQEMQKGQIYIIGGKKVKK